MLEKELFKVSLIRMSAHKPGGDPDRNQPTPKSFAQLFVRLRNGAEAAEKLGVPHSQAKLAEAKLLSDPAVKRQISKLDKEDSQTLCYVKTGLSRLAFGSVNDAAALVFCDEVTPEQILSADLFNVSEIKRVKGGGIEIKFFDRQRALEKLVELDPQLREISAAEEFLNAFVKAAEPVSPPDEEETE